MRSPVGDMILDAMRQAGLRQSQVSTLTRIPRTTLSQVISGSRTLSWETALNLENCLHFFDGENAIVEQYRFLKLKKRNEPRTTTKST